MSEESSWSMGPSYGTSGMVLGAKLGFDVSPSDMGPLKQSEYLNFAAD